MGYSGIVSSKRNVLMQTDIAVKTGIKQEHSIGHVYIKILHLAVLSL